jgi:HSP20 family protein
VKNSRLNPLAQIRERFPESNGVVTEMQNRLHRLLSGIPGLDLAKGFNPACNMIETERNYVFTADLPGMKQEDVRVELQNRELVISGERQEEQLDTTQMQHVIERRLGSFRRSITLPSDVDADAIEATFENAVLKIRIPKSEKARNRMIPIAKSRNPSLPGEPSRSETEKAAAAATRWGGLDPRSISDSHH